MAIPSDKESYSELVIVEQEENPQGNAGTGPTAQTTGADVSVTPLEANVQREKEIEQQDQEVEAGDNGSERTYARRVGVGSGHYPYANLRSYQLNNSESSNAYSNTSNRALLSPYPNAYLFNLDNHLSDSLNDCAHL